MSGTFAAYRALVCDLDGVVYRGPEAVPHAVESLTSFGGRVLYATNNASRSPTDVADHLRELGLAAAAADVVNSSQAAAWLLTSRLETGAQVLVIGGPGVATAVREKGFVPVRPGEPADAVDAVVQGYGPDVRAADLAEAAYAVQRGALWVATNTDATLPTDRGVAPGNGSLVAAVEQAVGRPPDLVAGKPEAAIYELCGERLGLPTTELLAVGDRLDTDIAGANALGMDSLIVLTGVDDLATIVAAPVASRPTWVATDLRALVDDESATEARTMTSAVRAAWDRVDRGEPVEDVLGDLTDSELLHGGSGEGSVG